MLIIDDKMFLTRIISVLFIDGIYVLNVLDGKINLLKLKLSQLKFDLTYQHQWKLSSSLFVLSIISAKMKSVSSISICVSISKQSIVSRTADSQLKYRHHHM